MTLRLFTAFHGNLDFSALPDADVPLVVERCYWPLLVLAEEERIPLGIELPARTLERLAREDPDWVKALRALAERGAVEVIGSGLAQLAGPLVPVDVNRANLRLGAERYRALLGFVPETWFVNEQTFSRGLAPLYAEAGARALVMEWNNPASRRPELRALRHRPVRLAEDLALLWNDSAVFQKLQRAAHGVVPADEYLDFVLRAHAPGEERLVCAYGGDLEIFDYRPGHAPPAGADRGVELERLRGTLVALARDPRCRFALPRDARSGLEPGPVVELASAEEPIPCKKQPRYNPTRWAVSGRDAVGQNARCYRLRRELAAMRALAGARSGAGGGDDAAAAELVALWRSDLRTRATEEKLEDFHARAARLAAHAQERLARLLPAFTGDEDALVVNGWEAPWDGEIVEVPLRFPPGRLRDGRIVASPAAALPDGAAQLEVRDRHRDGSARRAVAVIAPRLAPGETLRLRVVAGADAFRPEGGAEGLRTGAVEASLLPHRGGALRALRFPALAPHALVGTIPHGSFDHVVYTPDFYSGHAVVVTETGDQITDLVPVGATRVLAGGPLRTAVELRTTTPLGEWRKRWVAYRDRPRLDLVQELVLREVRLRSLRVASVTWLPDAFARTRLSFATVNGGAAVERFAIPMGARLEQPRAAAPNVSATSCLGATEGWVAAGDDRAGVAVIGDRAAAAVVPMLEFADVDDAFLLRLHHTAAETDETRATFFRGTARFAVALVGHGTDPEPARAVARAIERGLPYRTEQGVGVAVGL